MGFRFALVLLATMAASRPAVAATPQPGAPKAAVPALPPGMQWHVVKKGQKLGTIAKSHHLSIAALCHANDIVRRAKLHPGTKLVIPAPNDADGARARTIRFRVLGLPERPPLAQREKEKRDKLEQEKRDKQKAENDKPDLPAKEHAQKGKPAKEVDVKSAAAYLEAPKKKGWIALEGNSGSWHGQLVARGKPTAEGRRALARVLATSGGEQAEIDAELTKLIARVSDAFGGRPLKVVSGYRAGGTSVHSRHRQGKALDFVVDGVPIEALRDYCKTFDDVGVGYYPNSGFVHLDVRDRSAYWIDTSARGEPPRYTNVWTKPDGGEEKAR